MAMARQNSRFLLTLRQHLHCRSFSAEATTTTTAARKHKVDPSVYTRLVVMSGKNPSSVSDAADKLWSEGTTIAKREVDILVKVLRNQRRFDQALQLSEWMRAKGMPLTAGYHAVRLDLISTCQGVEFGEKYYESLPDDDKKHQFISSSLLNCYCRNKMVEKAESLFEKMKNEGAEPNPLAYNNVMRLYVSVNQPKSALALAEEMKAQKITMDKLNYNLLMNIYSDLNDTEGANRVAEEIKGDKNLKPDWVTYSNLVSLYIKASLFDKAESVLKEMEKLANPKEEGFRYLISLYANTGNLSEVKRVWEALRSAFPEPVITSYLIMVSSLMKLNDISGAEACFKEWESGCKTYDIRMVTVMMKAYLKLDMLKDAELIYDGAVKKGAKPNISTLELLIDHHLKKSDSKETLKYMNAALSKGEGFWKPGPEKVQLVQKCFEENGDVDSAEEFHEKLKEVNLLDTEAYNSLLRTYVAAGKTNSLIRGRIEADDVQVNSETQKLLKKVCPS